MPSGSPGRILAEIYIRFSSCSIFCGVLDKKIIYIYIYLFHLILAACNSSSIVRKSFSQCEVDAVLKYKISPGYLQRCFAWPHDSNISIPAVLDVESDTQVYLRLHHGNKVLRKARTYSGHNLQLPPANLKFEKLVYIICFFILNLVYCKVLC